jgi:hypothetical protein
MNFRLLKTLTLSLVLIFAVNAKSDVINIFCDFSENSYGKQFSMVGVLTEGDIGDEIRGKFTFGLANNGELVETNLPTYKTVGTIERTDFNQLIDSDMIKIKFTNKNSEFNYIQIDLKRSNRKRSKLKMNGSGTYKSNCHANYVE